MADPEDPGYCSGDEEIIGHDADEEEEQRRAFFDECSDAASLLSSNEPS